MRLADSDSIEGKSDLSPDCDQIRGKKWRRKSRKEGRKEVAGSRRKKSETGPGDNLGPLHRLPLPVTCCEWLAAILLSVLSLTDTKNQLFVVSIRARQTFWRRVGIAEILSRSAKLNWM